MDFVDSHFPELSGINQLIVVDSQMRDAQNLLGEVPVNATISMLNGGIGDIEQVNQTLAYYNQVEPWVKASVIQEDQLFCGCNIRAAQNLEEPLNKIEGVNKDIDLNLNNTHQDGQIILSEEQHLPLFPLDKIEPSVNVKDFTTENVIELFNQLGEQLQDIASGLDIPEEISQVVDFSNIITQFSNKLPKFNTVQEFLDSLIKVTGLDKDALNFVYDTDNNTLEFNLSYNVTLEFQKSDLKFDEIIKGNGVFLELTREKTGEISINAGFDLAIVIDLDNKELSIVDNNRLGSNGIIHGDDLTLLAPPITGSEVGITKDESSVFVGIIKDESSVFVGDSPTVVKEILVDGDINLDSSVIIPTVVTTDKLTSSDRIIPVKELSATSPINLIFNDLNSEINSKNTISQIEELIPFFKDEKLSLFSQSLAKEVNHLDSLETIFNPLENEIDGLKGTLLNQLTTVEEAVSNVIADLAPKSQETLSYALNTLISAIDSIPTTVDALQDGSPTNLIGAIKEFNQALETIPVVERIGLEKAFNKLQIQIPRVATVAIFLLGILQGEMPNFESHLEQELSYLSRLRVLLGDNLNLKAINQAKNLLQKAKINQDPFLFAQVFEQIKEIITSLSGEVHDHFNSILDEFSKALIDYLSCIFTQNVTLHLGLENNLGVNQNLRWDIN